MKEIRTLIGVSLVQLNALFTSVEEVNEGLLASREMRAFDSFIRYHEAMLPDGQMVSCDISFSNQGIRGMFEIQKVQLKSHNSFVVKLVINVEQLNADYGEKPEDLRKQSKRRPGFLDIRPAIVSRIERALGFTEKVEPLHIIPT